MILRIAIISKYLKFVLPAIIVLIIVASIIITQSINQIDQQFDSQKAYSDVKYQLDLGPRTMDSAAHEEAEQWIISALLKSDWQVEIQQAEMSGQPIKNIIAKRGSGTPWIILASHYDSRSFADKDKDPAKRSQPVPGADDGASTVAILLELARVIPKNLNKQIWLVFFDNEDNGNSSGVSWSIGSENFVSHLQEKPNSVVVLDMLGDKNLNIYMEQNSNPDINTEIWGVAKELGYAQFIPMNKHSIIDDHIPFIQAGIRAVDVIDFDYPYWHTTQDTLDKISAESLKVVGDTILHWVEQYPK